MSFFVRHECRGPILTSKSGPKWVVSDRGPLPFENQALNLDRNRDQNIQVCVRVWWIAQPPSWSTTSMLMKTRDPRISTVPLPLIVQSSE